MRVAAPTNQAAAAAGLSASAASVGVCVRARADRRPHPRPRRSLCLLAGDISPVDVISHLPVLCEDQGVPYVFVPSKAELGAAAGTKRPTSCILIPASGKPGKGGVAFDAAAKVVELMGDVAALAPAV